MIYRVLSVEEWKRPEIVHEFHTHNRPMPDPRLACILGAFDGEELEAFVVCQLKLHSEPLVAYNPLAVQGLFQFTHRYLADVLNLTGVECYVAASSGRVELLAARLGFEPSEPMYVTRVGNTGRVQ